MAATLAKTDPKGMNQEIWAAIEAKFDPARALNCLQWIADVTGEEIPEQTGQDSVVHWFAETMKNGYLLSKLILTLDPDVKNRIGKRKWRAKKVKMPFQAMEQIELFGKACKEIGLREQDVCTSQDVWNKENPNQIISTLYALNAEVVQRGWNGPTISDSFKRAEENIRNFDEETLKGKAAAIPIWNQGSIQVERGPQLDGAGVVKTAGSENWKSSNILSKWEQGSIAHEANPALDKVIRTAGNEDWVASSEVPQLMKTVQVKSGGQMHDSHGVVRLVPEN